MSGLGYLKKTTLPSLPSTYLNMTQSLVPPGWWMVGAKGLSEDTQNVCIVSWHKSQLPQRAQLFVHYHAFQHTEEASLILQYLPNPSNLRTSRAEETRRSEKTPLRTTPVWRHTDSGKLLLVNIVWCHSVYVKVGSSYTQKVVITPKSDSEKSPTQRALFIASDSTKTGLCKSCVASEM